MEDSAVNFSSITRDNAREKLAVLWEEMERRFGFRMTIHDHAGVFSMPDGFNILPGRNVHQLPCCRYHQPDSRRGARCMAHCRSGAMNEARQRGVPFRTSCWRGVTELVMPVYRGNVHVATIFAGGFRLRENDGALFAAGYRRVYLAMPLWDDTLVESLSACLHAAGYSLLRIADNLREEFHVESGRRGRIRIFLSYHATRAITVGDLAEHLGLSVSRTSHILKKMFGMTFSELLAEERINSAKVLLVNSSYTLEEIAKNTGFSNEFYFSRVFRKSTGMPPGCYRRQFRVVSAEDA